MHPNIIRRALRKMLKHIDQKTSKNRLKSALKMVPRASPGPRRGLPGVSLKPPEAILENMQRDTKKQEKQKGSPDPIFQKNVVKFTDPGWTPKSPQERNKRWKAPFCLMPLWGWPFWAGVSINFPSIFRDCSMRLFSHFSTVSKNGKVLKTL